jgi:hypothetical protein
MLWNFHIAIDKQCTVLLHGVHDLLRNLALFGEAPKQRPGTSVGKQERPNYFFMFRLPLMEASSEKVDAVILVNHCVTVCTEPNAVFGARAFFIAHVFFVSSFTFSSSPYVRGLAKLEGEFTVSVRRAHGYS